MARSQVFIDAAPEEVFGTLSRPTTYASWLVGCKRIRAVDPEWPQADSKFHHAVGFGPLTVKDSTKVVQMEEGSHLVLEARARPAGVVWVHFALERSGAGTQLTLTEHPCGKLTRLFWTPLLDLLVHARNKRSLQRLKTLLESSGAHAVAL